MQKHFQQIFDFKYARVSGLDPLLASRVNLSRRSNQPNFISIIAFKNTFLIGNTAFHSPQEELKLPNDRG
jgi:hypothetical protein